MLHGPVQGHGVATAQAGESVPFDLVLVNPDPDSVASLLREGDRWAATAARYRQMPGLAPEVVRRASFTVEAIVSSAKLLGYGVCCVMAAVTSGGRVLGVSQYGPLSRSEGTLNLHATEPEQLAAVPSSGPQLRGIGTSLAAAVARDMARMGISTLYLHPFDREAETFWRHRGFGVCGQGGLMCIRGPEALEKLIHVCTLKPDCGDLGDCLLCGQRSGVAH